MDNVFNATQQGCVFIKEDHFLCCYRNSLWFNETNIEVGINKLLNSTTTTFNNKEVVEAELDLLCENLLKLQVEF